MAMCDGDLNAAIELAVGAPQPVERPRPKTAGEELQEDLEGQRPTEKELAEFSREESQRRERLDLLPLSRMAWRYVREASAVLKTSEETLNEQADPLVRESLETAGRDVYLISAKLHRALRGRDRHARHERDRDDDPVQNDWNGSAKVALISIERSEAAWHVIEAACGDRRAGSLADALCELERLTRSEFPRAMDFVRPGFDEPWR
jgi:hypothetical protein